MTDLVAREKRWYVQVISVVSHRPNIILKEIIIVQVTQKDILLQGIIPDVAASASGEGGCSRGRSSYRRSL